MAQYPYRIPSIPAAGYDREKWLNNVLLGTFNPRPPEWWLNDQQTRKHRDRKLASIIWTRNYKADRKFVIWSQAPDEDFRFLGYLE